MKTRKSGIITICLIIIILVFQMMPVVSNATESFGSHKNEEGLQLNLNPLHNSAAVLNNSSPSQTFQKLPMRKPEGSTYRSGTILSSRTEAVIPVQFADIRSMIRESIPHYFNGSKYKDFHLKI